MKLTDALLGEHGVIYALFDHVETTLPKLETLVDVQRVSALLTAAIGSHAGLEDDILFPALEPHLGQMGPLTMMRHEHREIESGLADVQNTDSFELAVERLRYALTVARTHFAKEEQVLFRMAGQVLSESQLEQLGARWAEERRVSIE
jgi:hemerythrin-like domain-containing protein